jgi:hypothetical protein
MLNHVASLEAYPPAPIGAFFDAGPTQAPAFFSLFQQLPDESAYPVAPNALAAALDASDDDESPIEWSEEDIVLLHWRLLKDLSRLADPETPLEEKFDTLRWVFTEPEKDGKPFSFVSCLRVVGCSPLSPAPYVGLVDAEEVRDAIRSACRAWLRETLLRYPPWVREAVVNNPEWVESRLTRNPQWINQEVKRVATEGDLFV